MCLFHSVEIGTKGAKRKWEERLRPSHKSKQTLCGSSQRPFTAIKHLQGENCQLHSECPWRRSKKSKRRQLAALDCMSFWWSLQQNGKWEVCIRPSGCTGAPKARSCLKKTHSLCSSLSRELAHFPWDTFFPRKNDWWTITIQTWPLSRYFLSNKMSLSSKTTNSFCYQG